MNNYANLKTIRDYIRFATSCFNEEGLYFGHGTDNAWDEAVALILHTLFLPHDIHPTVLEANLTTAEQNKLLEIIRKRVETRIPSAYLMHEAYFAGLPFYVDERVLIPRSPLGELIENHFKPWVKTKHIHRILDLCTGSGCIAIAAAKYFPDAMVDASDISPDALAVAKINVLRHGVEDQVQLYESDLFEQLPKEKYDIIISNPPYVCESEMDELPAEYHHEPKLGLEAGQSGLDFVARILHDARNYLKTKGVLFVEVGNSEVSLIEKFPHIPFTWLEFERGGGGVFMLTGEEVKKLDSKNLFIHKK